MDTPRFSMLLFLGAIALTSCDKESSGESVVEEVTKEALALEQIFKLQGEVSFTLEDGEALNRENPETFWIPPKERRENLIEADHVKIVFNLSDGKQTQGERMWVLVKSGNSSGYTGILDNDPYCTDQIKAGMEVPFEPRHVIDIYEVDSAETNEAEQDASLKGQPAAAGHSE